MPAEAHPLLEPIWALMRRMPPPGPGPRARWRSVYVLHRGRAGRILEAPVTLEAVAAGDRLRGKLDQRILVLNSQEERIWGELVVGADLTRGPLGWSLQSGHLRGNQPVPGLLGWQGVATMSPLGLRVDGRVQRPLGLATMCAWSPLFGLPGLVGRRELLSPITFYDEAMVQHEDVTLRPLSRAAILPWGPAAALWMIEGPSMPPRLLFLSAEGDLLVQVSIGRALVAEAA